jgi:osmotically-inducible protein OsmY
MAFGNFWRGGGRERFGSERDQDRNRERWRTTGSDWRDAERDRWRDNEQRESRYGGEGYGSERYGSERYGSERYGSERYGSEGYGGGGSEYDYRGGSLYGGGSQRGYGSSGGSSYGTAGSYGGESRSYGSESPWGSQGRSSGQGIHRGRGPRNYKRADERIREDVCECLTEDAYIDASSIDVAVTEGEVVLTGTVFQRDDKRRAEDIAEGISGVKDVRNNLRVSSELSGERSGQGQQGSQQSQPGQQGQQAQTGQSPRH